MLIGFTNKGSDFVHRIFFNGRISDLKKKLDLILLQLVRIKRFSDSGQDLIFMTQKVPFCSSKIASRND